MKLAKIQHFCTTYNIELRYFNGKEVYPSTFNKRNKASSLYNIPLCLIWRPQENKNNFGKA